MKKSIILLFILLTAIMISCSEDKQESQNENSASQTAQNTDEKAENEADVENKAICLWPKVGMRSAPGRDENAKYLTTIYFGEWVSLTGKSKEKEDKNYVEITLSDGSEGWVYEYLLGQGSEMAVATATVPLYKRPDLATMQGKNFDKGDFIVLKPAENGWREAVGFERKHEGWVQESAAISKKQEDAQVVMLYKRAMTAEKASEKQTQLEAILSNPAFASSDFIYLVRDALNSGEQIEEVEVPEVDIKDNELLIIANKLNVRSSPSVEEDNVVFQIAKGDIATVIVKSKERVQVNGMEDYWYKISYEGQEGWIFGYHTSRRIGL